ncbi:hypothetical protein NDU88_001446 [Pleurodeles waltl]|uniref:Uncharacterized protein n=1 Tax=Pleurodeles waltl TaxID=8319 RepID=A0AAV7P8Q2_PLEWA|nr:hypothetical protein NDU88_001446 [Pleurodeles waltl]
MWAGMGVPESGSPTKDCLLDFLLKRMPASRVEPLNILIRTARYVWARAVHRTRSPLLKEAELCTSPVTLYEETLSAASLAASQRAALLISLPKPVKNPAEQGSYRPMAMLNTDYKILAKVLAMQLRTHTTSPRDGNLQNFLR